MAEGSGDRRRVSTDALETLGTLLDETAQRDAIHLAVEPVIAAHYLDPGQCVRVLDGKAYPSNRQDALGIVDPFLEYAVEPGDRFWFVMMPRTVQSLRHVWTHPAFPDVDGVAGEVDPSEKRVTELRAESERWLRRFVDENPSAPTYESLIAAARGNQNADYLLVRGQASGDIPDVLWDHVEIVTGATGLARAKWFSCRC